MIMVLTHMTPSVIHLWITLISALLLSIFYRNSIGSEAHFLPLLFLMISMANVKILPLYYSLSYVTILNPHMIGVLYHFSFLFASFLFVASIIFQQTLSTVRFGQYTFIGGAFSLLIALLVPMSTNSASFLKEASITDTLFLGITIMLNALAVISSIIAYVEERGGRKVLARSLAFILIIVGNTMVTISQETLYNSLGLTLYVAGSILLIFITRTYHSWT